MKPIMSPPLGVDRRAAPPMDSEQVKSLTRPVSVHLVEPSVIKVIIASQYGQEVIRPACPRAEIFCEISGSRTLTRRLIEQIKRLGYRVEVVPTQPKEL